MDAVRHNPPDNDRAVQFDGRWQEFLGIAVTNLLLAIVTLGIYRFWGQARVRRYLWSRTRLVGSELEWTGTGGEMFVGFLIVMGSLLGISILLFGVGALLGEIFLLGAMFAFYVLLFWGFGFAQFRALRYRLSRTYWRGIRGGSDENGVSYGWAALGRNIGAALSAGLAYPWAVTENWNDRIMSMSFGPHRMQSQMHSEGLMRRWLLVYPIYIGFVAMAFVADPEAAEAPQWTDVLPLVALIAGIAVVMVAFWALFYRKAAASFSLGSLTAEFDVSTAQWFKFYAKLAALTVATLGLGLLMWQYFHWKFVMDRLALYGEIDLDELTQSQTAAPKDAEGFADAFDVGAF